MSSIDKNKPVLKSYWRSLDQLEDNQEYRKFLEAEFPEEESSPTSVTRRTFLSTIGATLAFAGLTGCRRPVEKIVPFVNAPEDLVLGIPEQYATTMPFGTSSYGLVVTCQEGRPIKIEGIELHPSTLGKSNNFMQASILNLYDPDRSKEILHNGAISNWQEFSTSWAEEREKFVANKGEGLAFLITETSSPSVKRLHKEFGKIYPRAKWVTYSHLSDENIQLAKLAGTGKNYNTVYHYDKADVIAVLDGDPFLLDSDNVTNALGFANGRKVEKSSDKMNRLYVAEAGYSTTGAMADHRLKLKSAQVSQLIITLAKILESKGLNIPLASSFPAVLDSGINSKWITVLADDLLAHKGNSLVVAGRRQPAAIQALIIAINSALGNDGKSVEYFENDYTYSSDLNSFKILASDINNGLIDTLFIFGGNPVSNSPADIDFLSLLEKVNNTYYAGDFVDSTAKACNWHFNSSHFLESWGDASTADGILSIIQPMIQPLFFGKSDLEIMNQVIYGESATGFDIVRETWKKILKNKDYESAWRKVLHDGLFTEVKEKSTSLNLKIHQIKTLVANNPLDKTSDGIELIFTADPSVYDGSFANNGWMQELPDPITKLIWDNAALISAGTAENHKLANGDFINITFNGKNLEIPVWIVPGQADDTIMLRLGYGKHDLGRIAENVGWDVNILRTTSAMSFVSGAKIEKTGKKHDFATTQNHGSMEGRPLIRETSIEEYRKDPKFAQHEVHVPDLQSLWNEHQYDEGYQWGMSIDLNACIGCGGCTISCQSENNIPVVGKENADYGREMHWMRVDRYFNGDTNEPTIGFQPMACQHCEMAPCEQVCPVAATTHDREGLNVMTYNRCIGTRYCSNNCAYKVRRFNFFNYTNELPELVKMVQNPDVTVRSRGVMEKCTFCLQRINRAKRSAKLEGRTLKDGEVRTACQQACPTDAIKFGNILDKKSDIVKAKQSERTYEVLAEFNLRPRTSYQARLRNPNPALES